MTENELSKIVIGCAIEVHTELGAGLLESVYEECLYMELNELGIKTERQKQIPIRYKGKEVDTSFRIDLMVENKLIIELKACSELNDIHLAQTLTYLKLSDCKLGLLINFNVPLLKQGIRRVANNIN
jgi:GxxExxY protein